MSHLFPLLRVKEWVIAREFVEPVRVFPEPRRFKILKKSHHHPASPKASGNF